MNATGAPIVWELGTFIQPKEMGLPLQPETISSVPMSINTPVGTLESSQWPRACIAESHSSQLKRKLVSK